MILRWLLLLAVLAAPAFARRVEIRVLHTTDLHGHLLPTRDYEGRDGVGGLLRCATLIRQLRAEREHVLLVDCGDLYQGSAESLLTEGKIMTRALAALGYDAWVLGNHEFDWGLPVIEQRQAESSVPVLAGNIVTRLGGQTSLGRVQPFLLREYEGVKVALVGLTTPGIPTWSLPDQLGDLEFQTSTEALRRILPAVRAAEPDILILAAHQGLKPQGDDQANELNALARQFPEFHAILGGHSHKVEQGREVGASLYTQAGYLGIWLGCLDLAYDTVERRVVSRTARAIEVGSATAEDAELAAMFKADLDRARRYLDEPVGACAERLEAALDAQGRSPVQQLLARAVAEAGRAEVVLHGVLSEEPLEAGPVRMADVWRVVPYENRIGVALLTPQELQEILAENRGRQGTIHHMGLWGARVDQDGALVLADGSRPHPRKRLRVAFNSYALASAGGRFPVLREVCHRPEARLEVMPVQTRAAVLDYLKRHRPLRRAGLMEP